MLILSYLMILFRACAARYAPGFANFLLYGRYLYMIAVKFAHKGFLFQRYNCQVL